MLGPQLVIEDDPTPLAMAVAADVRRRLAEPDFADRSAGVEGSAGFRVGAGPEAVTVEAGGPISVRHGIGSADVVVTLDSRHRWDGEQVDGATEHPQLARWASELVSPAAVDWRDAAERLWAELESAPGAPRALLVTEIESGDRVRFGDDPRAYEIRGEREALLDLLEGRSALMEEASAGSIQILGSFAEISVITGAMWRVRVGGGGDG